MATKEQIFGLLAGASGPMSRVEIAKEVGEEYQRFQTQLDRYEKQGLVENVGEHHYVLTEKGREESLAEGAFKDIVAARAEGQTEETLGSTEYQQFIKLGKATGVIPLALIVQTADHIWNGGNYTDLTWVALGMQQMGIRQDLRTRWFHSWRSYLKQGLPENLPAEFLTPPGGKSEESPGARPGKRDYILGLDDLPTYVGEGMGDLDYKDAVDLSKIRTVRKKDAGAPASVGSMAEEVTKIFTAFKELMGDKVAGKSYVVTQGDEGYEVQEVDPNKPWVVPQASGPKTAKSFFVDKDGTVQELDPNRPMVIVKEAPTPALGGLSTQYLIDGKTGALTEVKPGQPIIIKMESAPASQATPIHLTDKDGNPMIMDLSTLIRLEDHRDQQKRDQESHDTKMEIAKTFKELLEKAGKAMSHMAEEGE